MRNIIYHPLPTRHEGTCLWVKLVSWLLGVIDYLRFFFFRRGNFVQTLRCSSAILAVTDFSKSKKENISILLRAIRRCSLVALLKIMKHKKYFRLLAVPGERIWYSFYDLMASDYHPKGMRIFPQINKFIPISFPHSRLRVGGCTQWVSPEFMINHGECDFWQIAVTVVSALKYSFTGESPNFRQNRRWIIDTC